MKEPELSVEEKAKRYDVAKQIMEEYMKSGGDAEATDTIKRAFPELENMDEKIIKKIIHLVKKSREQGGYALHEWEAKEMLAWLEKKKDEQENNDDDFTIYHPLKNGKGEYECIPYSFYGLLISFSEDKDLIDFLHTCFYTQEECEEWIRNHNKQKWDEDERIRNRIIERLKCMEVGSPTEIGEEVAWLEKRGEQKPQRTISIDSKESVYSSLTDFEKAVKQVMEEAIECGDTHNLKADADMLLRLAQKPAWSEDDERILKEMLTIFSLEKFEGYNIGENNEDALRFFKSLKDRYTWKPSDEQIEALRIARDRNDRIGFYLSQLYDDLKNLNKS